MKPLTSTTAPLTADQLRIAQLYAVMDERHQRQVMLLAGGYAANYPRQPAPVLRLVSGGAK